MIKRKQMESCSNFSNLPLEIYFEIMKFLPHKPLKSFISTSKEIYGVFLSYRMKNLDYIRLSYLNNKKESFNRLINVFHNEYEKPKILSCGNVELLLSRMLIHCGSEINKIILKEIFNFNENHQQQLVVAGGFVLYCLCEKGRFPGDIDVFYCENGCDNESSNQNFKKFLVNLDQKLSSKEFIVVKNTSTLNVFSDGAKPIQFIFRRVANLEYLLCFFDIDAPRFAFNGKKCRTIYEGIRALNLKKNICQRQHYSKRLYYRRAVKYSLEKGFTTVFCDIHPLSNYFKFKTVSEIVFNRFSTVGDANTRELWVDVGLYTPFLRNVTFEQYKELAELGFEEYYKKYCNAGIDDYFDEYEDNNYQIPLKGRVDDLKEALMKDKYFCCKSFKELLTMDVSNFFSEGYFERKQIEPVCEDEEEGERIFEDDKEIVYEPFCDTCFQFNESKKELKRDLTNFVAVVTGGRIKIGYETCLLLLRNNCYVITTTRFPFDALKRYKGEKDYQNFKNRLEIHPLDLRKVEEVNEFCDLLKKKFKRIHILINNAAQTIRYPIWYYKNLIFGEVEDICKTSKDSKKQGAQVHNKIVLFRDTKENLLKKFFQPHQLEVITSLKDEKLVKRAKTLSCFFDNVNEDDFNEEKQKENFPENKKDDFGEQVDKREKTSWNSNPTEISQKELFETQIINSVSPSILIQNLFNLMRTKKKDKEIGYIINVTSVEGSFDTIDFTGHDHVHTNMSKSALNQFTRSSSTYFAQNGIIINSVDTGWISSFKKDPWRKPPLTTKDGAYRILNPVFSNKFVYGKLLKNYKVAKW